MKLTDGVVVKFGLGVAFQEASAQRLALRKVNREVLHISQVDRFFTRPSSKL